MGLNGTPIIGSQTYRVTAPDFIPCFPTPGESNPQTSIPRGKVLRFLSETAGLWEVEFFDLNDPSWGNKRGLVGDWAFQWLLPIHKRTR
jgi:hypothetical protein